MLLLGAHPARSIAEAPLVRIIKLAITNTKRPERIRFSLHLISGAQIRYLVNVMLRYKVVVFAIIIVFRGARTKDFVHGHFDVDILLLGLLLMSLLKFQRDFGRWPL